MSKKDNKAAVENIRFFDVIREPYITEKTTNLSENNQIVLKVANSATKQEIKEAVHVLFKVDVVSVNTIKQKGKAKLWRGKPGKQKDYKKAIIRIKEGQSVDIAAGL